jgi:hypothetical protein
MIEETLAMTVYGFYNYMFFINELVIGWEECDEEYWIIMQSEIKKLINRLESYWEKITRSQILDVVHSLDFHNLIFIENWTKVFENFVTQGHETLDMNFNQLKKYIYNFNKGGKILWDT